MNFKIEEKMIIMKALIYKKNKATFLTFLVLFCLIFSSSLNF